MAHGAARHVAPDGDRTGSLTFTTDVTVSSGIRNVKVLGWPANSPFAKEALTAKDIAALESAVCKSSGEDTVRCTYTATVTRADAEASPHGLWHVAVLATAKDGRRRWTPRRPTSPLRDADAHMIAAHRQLRPRVLSWRAEESRS
ncbi:DUF5707 domain-containing protein [Streptomyces canus]|uniref:DUF5707 domain-containing protein n=1 Tax=Streptomyces canus TaxID=58343 RepID=UPI00367C44C8